MKCKSSVFINNCVARIGTALKANNDISFGSKHIGNFTLALIAPVGAYDRFDHVVTSGPGIRNHIGYDFAFSGDSITTWVL